MVPEKKIEIENTCEKIEDNNEKIENNNEKIENNNEATKTKAFNREQP